MEELKIDTSSKFTKVYEGYATNTDCKKFNEYYDNPNKEKLMLVLSKKGDIFAIKKNIKQEKGTDARIMWVYDKDSAYYKGPIDVINVENSDPLKLFPSFEIENKENQETDNTIFDLGDLNELIVKGQITPFDIKGLSGSLGLQCVPFYLEIFEIN